MSIQSHTNTPQRLLIAFAVGVAFLVSVTPISGAGPTASVADASSPGLPARGLSPALRAAAGGAGGPIRVRLLLTDNAFVARLRGEDDVLSGRMKGAAAARAAAKASPRVITSTEIEAGHAMDAERNEAIAVIKHAATPGARQNARVADLVRTHGGTVESALPIPNQVVAVVPRGELVELSQSPDIYRVESARKPEWQISSVDGSVTWHANGYTGGGASADNIGGPDFAEIDTGIRTTHIAFKSRLPGDCATCAGSGPSRVVTPANQTDFSGGEHGNAIAATVAATDLRNTGSTGMAYGLDKLQDASSAQNPYYWIIGQPYNGEPGVSDLPENLDYSAGIYEDTVDYNTNWTFFDALADRLGISMAVSAGNCGVVTIFYTGCSDGPHRVSTPATNFNTIAVGGLSTPNINDESTWTNWANSSPGPTWGGRKKPDLIAEPSPIGGGPSNTNDTTYGNPGNGTSFAAPQVSGGAILLASVGVYAPTAQKAIMINAARPIQNQTYWTPTTGWGSLNMDTAFYDRGNYANGSITPSGDNGVRFYQQAGVTAGDRTTLVWNRRTTGSMPLGTSDYALTNLDLAQVSQSTGATTASGGSDAADAVDTDPTVSAANPMPGNGSDGGDNVEQVRSTASGTQILKVKAMSAIAGAAAEPFSIAAHRPLTALETPIPSVDVAVSPVVVAPGDTTTVTAAVTNSSADLALSNADVTLTPPAGVSITSGTNPQSTPTIAADGTTIASWTVKGNTSGLKTLSASVSATTYDETFTGTGTDVFTVDGAPPTTLVSPMAAYSATASPTFAWSATDSQSPLGGYDVDAAIDQGGWVSQLTNSPQTSLTLTAGEGQLIRLRVRATDALGNTSPWSEVSTTIDAVPPVVSFGTPDTSVRGTIRVPIFLSNAGSPVTGRYTFADTAGGRTGVVASGQYVTYKNIKSKQVIASLRATATDALGRSATSSQDYPVQTRLAPNGMRVLKLSRVGRYVKISGKTQKKYNGKVTFSAKRIGKKGTRKASKRVKVKKGRFTIKIRVAKGRYKFVVTAGSTSKYAETSISKKLTVK